MSYGTVAEADTALGHVPAWLALDDPDKQRRLDTAALWLGASYTVPAAPDAAELVALVAAEQEAARVSLTTDLFPEPGTEAQGARIYLREQVDVIETEERWSEPAVPASGPVRIDRVSAVLATVGIYPVRAADGVYLPMAFVV